MKKIYIFYLFKKPTLQFLNLKRNSLFINEITKTKDSSILKVDFQSKFSDKPEEVILRLADFSRTINLSKALESLIDVSYEWAKTLSKENMGNINGRIKSSILSTIESSLMKCQYGKKDIFYLASNIFFNVNVTHKLINGNKRLATSLLIRFLYSIGYYFKFQGNEYKDYRDWEKKCVEYISRNEKKEDPEKIIEDIREWIIQNIVISLNFR